MAKRLGRRSRQLLRILHFVSSVGWLGVGFAQLTLGATALGYTDLLARHHGLEITSVLGQALSAPLAITATVTGIVLSTRGSWGLTQYRWVAVKLVLTVVMVVFGATLISGWFEQAVSDTAVAGGGSGTGLAAARAALLGGVGNVVTMLFLVVISVVKPWGQTARGRRISGADGPGAQRAATPHGQVDPASAADADPRIPAPARR